MIEEFKFTLSNFHRHRLHHDRPELYADYAAKLGAIREAERDLEAGKAALVEFIRINKIKSPKKPADYEPEYWSLTRGYVGPSKDIDALFD